MNVKNLCKIVIKIIPINGVSTMLNNFIYKICDTVLSGKLVQVTRCHECDYSQTYMNNEKRFCRYWCTNCPDKEDFYCYYGRKTEHERKFK